MDHMTMVEPIGEWPPPPPSVRVYANTLNAGRHHRGWPRVQLLTWVTVTEQSWRYCIDPMGYRDTIWERSGYVEIIVWRRHTPNAETIAAMEE